jgi:hypothetical protein
MDGQAVRYKHGNLSAELDSTDSAVKGLIRFMDDRWGLVVYSVAGTLMPKILQKLFVKR